jgi:hypothetical protein
MDIKNTDVALVMESLETGKAELILIRENNCLMLEVDQPEIREDGGVYYTNMDLDGVRRLKAWLNIAFPEA